MFQAERSVQAEAETLRTLVRRQSWPHYSERVIRQNERSQENKLQREAPARRCSLKTGIFSGSHFILGQSQSIVTCSLGYEQDSLGYEWDI